MVFFPCTKERYPIFRYALLEGYQISSGLTMPLRSVGNDLAAPDSLAKVTSCVQSVVSDASGTFIILN